MVERAHVVRPRLREGRAETLRARKVWHDVYQVVVSFCRHVQVSNRLFPRLLFGGIACGGGWGRGGSGVGVGLEVGVGLWRGVVGGGGDVNDVVVSSCSFAEVPDCLLK